MAKLVKRSLGDGAFRKREILYSRIKTSMLLFCGGSLLGITLGISFMTNLYAASLEKYSNKISYLESMIEDRENRLEQLEKTINTNKYIIKSVEVTVSSDDILGDATTLLFEKKIKEKYKNLIGQPVKEVDVFLVEEVINNRIFKTDLAEYKVQTEKIILSEIIYIWVFVKRND